jgi:glycosyltransferase involved in cell wall biosynthesis
VHKPRLGHIIHSDGAGGGPVVVCQLLEGLKNDFDQVVFCGGKGRLTSYCLENNIPVRHSSLNKLREGLFSIFQLASQLRRERIDIVILHGQWAGPLGALAARLAGVKTSIYIAHCPAFYHSTNLFRVVRNYLAEKIPCALCTRVVALSEGNYYNYLFRGWAPETHLIHIPNGVDPDSAANQDEAAKEVRRKYGFDPDARHCIFVGRLDDQKRPDWLVNAWAETQKRRTATSRDWHLWVVGDGEKRESTERLAQSLGLEQSIHFVGNQPTGLAWINAGDLVVATSMYEGHALVPLEAMASSRAVVAFSTDGITDSIISEKTGVLCEIGDTIALGRAIARLLENDEDRQNFGRHGHLIVQEKFSVNGTVDRYRSLIHVLLSLPRSA